MSALTLLIYLLFFIFLGFLFALWISSTSLKPGEYQDKIYTWDQHGPSKPVEPESVRQIKVMSWNISYAHGRGSDGRNFKRHSKEAILHRLDEIAKVINSENPDIVLIQEIDRNSRKTHYIDQLKFLSEKTGLKHAAFAQCWDARYIPYPYFRFKDHFGKVVSGGAVLSKFPILDSKTTLIPKIGNFSFFFRRFYLFRYIQITKIRINEKALSFLNTHFDATEPPSREHQRAVLLDLLNKSDKKPILLAGDFNSLPPGAKVQSQNNEKDVFNYKGDSTIESLQAELEDYREAVPRNEYLANEAKYFTFPSDGPNRRLDYFFIHRDFEISDFKIRNDNQWSDHFAITIQVKI